MEKDIELYTIPEVAKMLRVNQVTVNRMIKRQELRAYKFGKVYRISKNEVEDYLQKSLTSSNIHEENTEKFSTAGSILKYVGTWEGPKEEYAKIMKAIEDADAEAEF